MCCLLDFNGLSLLNQSDHIRCHGSRSFQIKSIFKVEPVDFFLQSDSCIQRVLSHWILEENILMWTLISGQNDSEKLTWISVKSRKLPFLSYLEDLEPSKKKTTRVTCRPHIHQHRNNKTAHLVTRKGVANARPSYTKWPGRHEEEEEEEVYCRWMCWVWSSFSEEKWPSSAHLLITIRTSQIWL